MYYVNYFSFSTFFSISQAVTRELKEQSALLQATRAEIQRLKQPLLSASIHSASTSSFPACTPPPTLTPISTSEKKQSNNVSTENQPIQAKKRQLEYLIKKVRNNVL